MVAFYGEHHFCVGSANNLAIRLPHIAGKVSVVFLPDLWSFRRITDANSSVNRRQTENYNQRLADSLAEYTSDTFHSGQSCSVLTRN